LSPSQLAEYTDNDILEEVYRRRQYRKSEEKIMQRQAWYNWLCSTNRPIFGQTEFTFRTFEELFPDEEMPPTISESPSEIIAACEKMGIRPPTRF